MNELILKGTPNYNIPEFKKLSAECINFMKKLMNVNYHLRLSAADALKVTTINNKY